MSRKLLVTVMTVLFTTVFGAGIANALPTTYVDSTNTTVNFWTGSDVAAEPVLDYNSVANSGAEHKTTSGTAPSQDGERLSYGPHGKFTTDTNACGRCHQLHQAQTSRLIRFNTSTNTSGNNDIYKICTYCHNFNGQSTYDVKDGMIWDSNNSVRYATNGGGFERQLVVEGSPAIATVVKAASSHQVNKATNITSNSDYMRFNAPGASTSRHFALKCSSCHNPHGSSNARILVENALYYTTNNGNVTGTVATTSGMPQFVANRFNDEVSKYPTSISDFCGGCHTDYLNKTNDGSTLTNGKYRHKINMAADNGLNKDKDLGGADARNDGSFGYITGRLQLPLGTDDVANPTPLTAGAATFDKVVCTTCHFAHGTGAEITNNIVAGTDQQRTDTNATGGNEYYLTTTVNSQYMETIKNLRMDNRGVCQNCHNRESVDQTAPALAEVKKPDVAYNLATKYSTTATLAGVYANGETGSNFVVIRFDQYMAKDSIETLGNIKYDADGAGGGAAVNPVAAKLDPDGRSVTIELAAPPTINTSTIVVTTNVKNINGIAIAGQDTKIIQ